MELVPDRHRVNQGPLSVVRGNEAVGAVSLFNELAEIRGDLEAALVVDTSGGMPQQDTQFHPIFSGAMAVCTTIGHFCPQISTSGDTCSGARPRAPAAGGGRRYTGALQRRHFRQVVGGRDQAAPRLL